MTATSSRSGSTSECGQLVAADGPRRSGRVELVRVVEDGRLGRPGGSHVVVRCDRMEELGMYRRVEHDRPLLDQAEAEVDMPEQAPLLRLPEGGAALQLADPPDVVQQSGDDQQVGAKPRVQLGA